MHKPDTMFVLDSEESGIMPLSLNNVFRSNFTLSAYYCDIWGKNPVTTGHGNTLSLTKRLKASLVFWKQSMNSASLGGLARRVSMPSVGVVERETPESEHPCPGHFHLLAHRGHSEKGAETRTARNQGCKKTKSFPLCWRLCVRCEGTADQRHLPSWCSWRWVHGRAAASAWPCRAASRGLLPTFIPGSPFVVAVPAGPFFLFFFPFFLWLSCLNASAAF